VHRPGRAQDRRRVLDRAGARAERGGRPPVSRGRVARGTQPRRAADVDVGALAELEQLGGRPPQSASRVEALRHPAARTARADLEQAAALAADQHDQEPGQPAGVAVQRRAQRTGGLRTHVVSRVSGMCWLMNQSSPSTRSTRDVDRAIALDPVDFDHLVGRRRHVSHAGGSRSGARGVHRTTAGHHASRRLRTWKARTMSRKHCVSAEIPAKTSRCRGSALPHR
jgi:hypothetical protein